MNKINEVKNCVVKCQTKVVKAKDGTATINIYVQSLESQVEGLADEDAMEWVQEYAYCGKDELFIDIKARYDELLREKFNDFIGWNIYLPMILELRRKMVFGCWCVSATMIDVVNERR